MPARGDYAEIFGARLRELRAAAGLTQRELATRSGTSSAAISNFEAGNNAPTLGTLVRLADALDCNVTDLVGVLDRKTRAAGSRRT
ncbi:MAG TPA: helix-turn-helix transcriptional regulator [Thermoanaerobaculia bacterium]|jgi:transcriptional regulator with XRE-family HTH domain